MKLCGIFKKTNLLQNFLLDFQQVCFYKKSKLNQLSSSFGDAFHWSRDPIFLGYFIFKILGWFKTISYPYPLSPIQKKYLNAISAATSSTVYITFCIFSYSR